MNTANLQIAGVLAALATVLDLLREKAILSADEIDAALAATEETLRTDRRPAEVSRANVEAMCFPLRILRAANRGTAEAGQFTELATLVGQTRSG